MDRPHRLTDRARQLRRDLTPAEKILWPVLRNRAFGGLKFRRQQEIGPYIVDFFCAAVRVVVELDGESHVGTEVKDERRDRKSTRLNSSHIQKSRMPSSA